MALNPPANPVVVNPPAAPAAAQDRTKRSKDIALFYGQAGKDTISARLLIVRVNDTATIGNWAADRKILEFKMCLRDRAVAWFEGLIEEGLDINDWDVIKAVLGNLRAQVLGQDHLRQLHRFKSKIGGVHQRLCLQGPDGPQTSDRQQAGHHGRRQSRGPHHRRSQG